MKAVKAFVVAVLAVSAQASSADIVRNPVTVDTLAIMMNTVAPMNLINWSVGDEATYDVALGPFGKMGTMNKKVTKEEGNAIWIHTDIDLSIQKDNTDMLIDRADGHVIKFLHNGKEEAMPDDKPEIISQDTQDVTVPAGTFQSIHIVGKTKQIKQFEIWVNPSATVMEGTLKQVMQAQFEITMELTQFTRK